MYTPSLFAEQRPEVLAEAIQRHPLAALLTAGSAGRLSASHLPMLLGDNALMGHLARANPHWKEYVAGTEALAIFSGPQHYISPGWYPSKAEHGKVVPTWNYVVVHVRGTLTFHEDALWLKQNITALTDRQESLREDPWKVADAPADFIDGLVKSIIGVQMTITSLEGKWKVSQNRSEEDREGVIDALEELASEPAWNMAQLIRETLGK